MQTQRVAATHFPNLLRATTKFPRSQHGDMMASEDRDADADADGDGVRKALLEFSKMSEVDDGVEVAHLTCCAPEEATSRAERLMSAITVGARDVVVPLGFPEGFLCPCPATDTDAVAPDPAMLDAYLPLWRAVLTHPEVRYRHFVGLKRHFTGSLYRGVPKRYAARRSVYACARV
jgi:hypothetical protein